MTEDASAGRLYLEVVADASGLRADVRAKAEAATRNIKAKIELELDAARLRTEVRNAAGLARVQATVRFDQAQIRRELATKTAQAARDIKAQLNVEINDASARAAIAKLTRDGDAKVNVDADTTGAAAQIESLRRTQSRRPIPVKVQVDQSGLTGLGRALSSTGRIAAGLSRFPFLASGILVAAGALTNLAGGAFAATASLSQTVGVLAMVPNLAGVAVQGIATLLAGFSGIGDAVKGLQKVEQAGAGTAAATAAARQASAERVRAAQERVRDSAERLRQVQLDSAERVSSAQAAAAERIADARRREISAHESTRRALERLTEARREEIRRVAELRREVVGSALDEEAAQLALDQARARLTQLRLPGAEVGQFDLREADLAVRQAEHRLDEVRARQDELAREQDEADRTGIEGSARVVQAKREVVEAQDDEAEAARQVRLAHAEAAKDIARAQREARDAVRDARRDLVASQRDVAAALTAGTDAVAGQSAAVSALATVMSKLSPAGQRFARFLDGTLMPRFRRLRNSVQEALLPPLQEAITTAMPLLDVFERGLVGTGKALGKVALEGARMAKSPAFRDDIGKIMRSNNRATVTFGRAGNKLISMLRHIAVVAGPTLLEPFAQWVEKLTTAGNAAAATGRKTGTMAAFFERARKTTKKVLGILKDVGGAIYNLGRLSRPSGDSLLDLLANAAQRFRDATEDPKNQERIRRFFEETVPVMQQFGSALVRIVGLILRLGEIMGGGALDGLFAVLSAVLSVLEAIANLPGGGALLSAIFLLSGAGLGLGLVAKALGGIVSNIGKLAKYTGVAKLFSALTGGVGGAAGMAGKVAGKAGSAAKTGASKVGGLVADAAGALMGGIGGAASKAGAKVKAGAASLGSKAKAGVSAVGSKVGGLVTSRLGGRRGDRGSASVAGMVGGQAVAAGIAKAGEVAGRAAKQVGVYTASLVKAGGKAIVSGIVAGAGAIGSVAAAAGRGALALGTLAVGYARAGVAAAASGAKQLVMAAATGVVRVATAAWTAAQWLLNAALNANPISLIILAIAGLVAGVIWAWNNVSWFREGVTAAFQAIGSFATWLWQRALKPAFDGIGAAANWLWRSVLRPVFDAWKLVMSTVVGPAVTWLWRTIIQPAMSGIGSLIAAAWTKIKPIFELLKTGVGLVGTGFSTAVNAIKTAWNKLIEIAKVPVKFVVETVLNNGILAAWNKVAGFFGIKPDNLRISLPPGFERGGITGVMSGYSPGRDDRLIAVGGGEAVMRPEWTRAVGKNYVNASNRAARTGGVAAVAKLLGLAGDPSGGGPQYLGAFAGGGIVDGIASWFSAAKNFFTSGIRKAAEFVVDPVLNAIESKLSGSEFTRSLAAIPRRMVNNFLGWLDGKDAEIGGPGRKAVSAVRSQIGVPYSWGGGGLTGPSYGIERGANTLGFDCSGLMRYGWYQAMHKVMPRTTYGLLPWLQKVTGPPRAGDMGFPHSGHVWMFSGENSIIEAPYTGARVRETSPRGAYFVGRPPASFLADSGGMLPPGRSIIDNLTGANEWIMTPEAIRMLGGEDSVAAINRAASARISGHARGRLTSSPRKAPVGGRDERRPLVEQHIHPQPRQSEHEIGMVSARKIGELIG